MTSQNHTPDLHAAAWAFALDHEASIQKLSRRYASALSSDDRAEFVQDVIVRVVSKFPDYDPERSAPITWIVWQMRAVQQNWTRRWNKCIREQSGNGGMPKTDRANATYINTIPVGPDQYGSVEHFTQALDQRDAEAQIAEVYTFANRAERISMDTLLAGMPATELRKRHGMTGRSRTNNLRALGVRLEA